jgi:hypothetical protein
MNDQAALFDENLRAAVVKALAADTNTAPLNLRVGVLNAVAHLGGSVPVQELRKLAEEIAAKVPGIRGVVNRIDAPGAPAPGRIIHLDLPPDSSSKEIAPDDNHQ